MLSDFDGANSPDDRGKASAVKQAAQEGAGEGVGLVGEKAADVAGTAKDRAGDVAGEASARARDVADELRGQLRDQAQSQTDRLAHAVRQLADELGDMGSSGKDGSPATNAVRQVAGHGRDMAARLESRGPQGLLSDLQDFARRRPGMFLAGAALAGFATARLGKGVTSASGDAQAGGSASCSHDRGDGNREGPPGTSRAASPYDAPGSPDDYGEPRLTPSYGGSVAPPGPLPVDDPYPDPRRP
ncbi:hypothetical protein OG786_02170 [Streptomyces sp. NBC_00101]|uniref:hypothetical protein n=1 Tax=Streptomyces sp. NBC_00101 TaxID=2975651 RepID=UPI00324A9F8E